MANFPNSFDNNASLYVAVNNLRTRLTSAISASDLTIPVVSTASFPDSGFITIISDITSVTNPEAVRYTSKDATNFFATVRGADGTTAKAHGAGANVDLTVIAAHHNELKNAVIALEEFVGVSGSENFLRQDDFGNVIVTGTLNVTGATTLSSLSASSGAFSTSLTVSGLPVSTGGGVTDHGDLTGLGDDDHTQYSLVDGTRAFTGTVGGITPVSASDLATKGYVDSEIDTDIAAHAANSSAHHTRYSRAENDAILGTDGITIISGSNTITVQGFRPELLTVSGSLQSQIDGLAVGENAIVGVDGITVTSGSSTTTLTGFRGEFITASGFLQTQISANAAGLPVKGTIDFTTGLVDRAGGEREVNQSFNNRSLIRKLKVSPTVAGVNSYVIQFFTKDTFDFDDLLEYEATASGIFVDNDLWFHEDEDGTSEMHLKITNTSLFDSTFQVEMEFEKFA